MASLSIFFPEGVSDKYGMSLMVEARNRPWKENGSDYISHCVLPIILAGAPSTSSSRTS